MPEHPTIAQALAAVMVSVGAVAKTDRNQSQSYNFRGIDAVVNAVGPALREHGVIMVPHAGIPLTDTYQTSKGTTMTHVILPVTFTFHGPAGDVLDCQVYGEASDAGDKVLSKAHSVAWRVAMLEVFAIPTDDGDPDAESHERAAPGAQQPPPFDWAAIGWADQADHDSALEQCRSRAKALPEPKVHKVWLTDQGWKLPYTRGQMDAWADELDRLSVADPLACPHCQETPCVCDPRDLADAEAADPLPTG